MNRQKTIQYIGSNCFLFFIPVILLNILFVKYLPNCYLENISHIIVHIENILRIVLIALSTIMIIDIKDRFGKIGFLIYTIGVVVYFISYFILINYSDTAVVRKNMILQLSGHWSAIIWLIGIGLIGKRFFINIPYHYALYIILSIVFGIIHTYHGYILLAR